MNLCILELLAPARVGLPDLCWRRMQLSGRYTGRHLVSSMSDVVTVAHVGASRFQQRERERKTHPSHKHPPRTIAATHPLGALVNVEHCLRPEALSTTRRSMCMTSRNPSATFSTMSCFAFWYERSRHLTRDRHSILEHMFNAIERAGRNQIAKVEGFFKNLDRKDKGIQQSLQKQSHVYVCQLQA